MIGAGQTIVKYQDTALPTTAADVTLFNSTTAFGPRCFQHLGQQFFQYQLLATNAGGTGTINGLWSDDGGATYPAGNLFYTKATATGTPIRDEVYVGMYQDVKFTFRAVAANTTAFSAQLALNPNKADSRSAAADIL